jgi:Flp pilus assembly pilin Flp
MTSPNLNNLITAAEGEDGQALVEYALIIALVSLVAIGLLTAMGTEITDLLGRVTAAFESALP